MQRLFMAPHYNLSLDYAILILIRIWLKLPWQRTRLNGSAVGEFLNQIKTGYQPYRFFSLGVLIVLVRNDAVSTQPLSWLENVCPGNNGNGDSLKRSIWLVVCSLLSVKQAGVYGAGWQPAPLQLYTDTKIGQRCATKVLRANLRLVSASACFSPESAIHVIRRWKGKREWGNMDLKMVGTMLWIMFSCIESSGLRVETHVPCWLLESLYCTLRS